MINCENFEGIQKRYADFWDGKYEGDRPLIHLRAKKTDNMWYKGDIIALNHNYKSLEDFYLNEENVVARHKFYTENTGYFGEAFPSAVVNLGPGILAAYHGSQPRLMEDSVWFNEYVEEWDDDFVEFSEDNPWWQKTLSLTKALAESSKGNYMVGTVDLNSVSNTLSLIRGSENLAMDLIAEPENVIKYRDKVMKTWFYCQREIFKTLKPYQQGYTDWMGMYAPDLGVAAQCDFSTLISTDMFDEFFLDEIRQQCEEIPYPIYHLDGPACIRHLDKLLEIPKLRAVQWQPGAGAAPCCDPSWHDMLKKIQDSGRMIYVFAKMDEAKQLMQTLDTNKMFIYITEYAKNCDEAADFMKAAVQWSKK